MQLLTHWALVFAGDDLGEAAGLQCQALAAQGLELPNPTMVAYQRAEDVIQREQQQTPQSAATVGFMHGLDFASYFLTGGKSSPPGARELAGPSGADTSITFQAGPVPSESPTSLNEAFHSSRKMHPNCASAPIQPSPSSSSAREMRHTVSEASLHVHGDFPGKQAAVPPGRRTAPTQALHSSTGAGQEQQQTPPGSATRSPSMPARSATGNGPAIDRSTSVDHAGDSLRAAVADAIEAARREKQVPTCP